MQSTRVRFGVVSVGLILLATALYDKPKLQASSALLSQDDLDTAVAAARHEILGIEVSPSSHVHAALASVHRR